MNLRNCSGNPTYQSMNPTTYGNSIPMPVLPTGIPTGPAYNGITPVPSGMVSSSNGMTPASVMPATVSTSQTPQTIQSPYYLAGFLRRNIGQRMRVEFLIGSSGALVDRTGTLVDVGASYIVLQPIDSDDLVVADLYSIKFVTIIR